MKSCNFLLLLMVFHMAAAQTDNTGSYQVIRFHSSHTSFPDTGRKNGHMYDSVLYDAPSHYRDSSVLIIVPNNLKVHDRLDMVFWFHGWRNNIDSAATFYGLTTQFIASHRNAILVFAETAKDAPDSYGGKLEQENDFKGLVDDVLWRLQNDKYVSPRIQAGNIVLAGHSGAYRVIAYMLRYGGVRVKEVLLFDALYGELDKYSRWIAEGLSHHFVHWYTNHGGGTDQMSDSLMAQLQQQHLFYVKMEDTSVVPSMIAASRILFVHSRREHNEIINHPDNFQLLLENSFVLKERK